MAPIVIGMGTSHSPQLSTDPAIWHLHAERDRSQTSLLGTDGRMHTYEQLAAQAPPSILGSLSDQAQRAMADRSEKGLARLRSVLARADPDVAVIIGDDQDEMFGPAAVPAFALYTGRELWDRPLGLADLAALPAGISQAQWAQHAAEPDPYPVAAELSEYLARELTTAGFDLCVCAEQPEDRRLGHAFTFVRLRLGLARAVRVLPLFVNTYIQPNVASPMRCHALGRALRAAVEAWQEPARVAIVASGGLSHFVVDQRLDREILAALAARDAPRAAAAAAGKMTSGTSETLNWMVAAGALEHLRMEVIDYIPAYRSPAGTGIGLAFALWGGRPASQETCAGPPVHGNRRAGDEAR